jgi:hypothetical protein
MEGGIAILRHKGGEDQKRGGAVTMFTRFGSAGGDEESKI